MCLSGHVLEKVGAARDARGANSRVAPGRSTRARKSRIPGRHPGYSGAAGGLPVAAKDLHEGGGDGTGSSDRTQTKTTDIGNTPMSSTVTSADLTLDEVGRRQRQRERDEVAGTSAADPADDRRAGHDDVVVAATGGVDSSTSDDTTGGTTAGGAGLSAGPDADEVRSPANTSSRRPSIGRRRRTAALRA
jgi:hypothetical protein